MNYSGPITAATVVRERTRSERLAVQEFRLVLLNTDAAGTAYPLDRPEVKIGKSPENDVVIDHPTVSRNHLVVVRQGDRFLARDLDSTNGTFIDGAQVKESSTTPR
jgi:pSer/pThr/pTyr-binding forkhead associated (FHA) protein